MPHYYYKCPKCENIQEEFHSIKKNPRILCKNCNVKMNRIIGYGNLITNGIKETLSDHRESEHTKKVKDPERAIRSRKKEFGTDSVGNPKMSSDPRHIVKRGKTLGGQQKDIDKTEFIKAAAKDDYIVEKCKKIIDKSN